MQIIMVTDGSLFHFSSHRLQKTNVSFTYPLMMFLHTDKDPVKQFNICLFCTQRSNWVAWQRKT